MDYKKRKDETAEEFTYRICAMKEELGSWDYVADIINDELGTNLKPGTYRKQYQSFEKLFLGNKNILDTKAEEQANKLEEKIRELEETRIKLRDERAAYRRLVRDKSRNERIYELFKCEIKSFEPCPIYTSYVYEDDEKEMVIVLSDVHAGNGADNSFNTYNKDIMVDRLSKYLKKIKDINCQYYTAKCHLVLLGDLINGNIHTSIRIENKENVVQQIMSVSEAISEFAYALSSEFAEIHIYSVSGNHSRMNPNKDEHLKGENLDELIPFYMKARLAKCENVIFHENTIDESIGSFELCGKRAYMVHGDKDTVPNVVSKLTLMTGIKPDYVFMGHRHTNNLTTQYDTKVIESGCLSGADSYCMDKRLRNRPEQAVVICDKDGLYRYYDVKF